MKKQSLVAAFLAGSNFTYLSSCGLDNAVKGAGIGAVGGAAIGAGIGRVLGNTALVPLSVVSSVVRLVRSSGVRWTSRRRNWKRLWDAKIESVNDGQAIRVTFDSGILFATSSASLSAASQATLRKFAANLAEHSDTDLLIVGHTDNTGSDRVNNPLSYKSCCQCSHLPALSGSRRDAYEGRR